MLTITIVRPSWAGDLLLEQPFSATGYAWYDNSVKVQTVGRRVICPGGEIGRHASFRCWSSQGGGGSSPLLGTKLVTNPCNIPHHRYLSPAYIFKSGQISGQASMLIATKFILHGGRLSHSPLFLFLPRHTRRLFWKIDHMLALFRMTLGLLCCMIRFNTPWVNAGEIQEIFRLHRWRGAWRCTVSE